MEKERKKTLALSAVSVVIIATVLVAILVLTHKKGSESSYVVEREANTPFSESVYNYLVLGKDRVSGLTDVMMVVSLDSAELTASVIQIPRDTYARYTDSGYRKINGALSALGAEGLCDFIEENIGVAIDGYFIFELDTFSKAIDAIGGVEIDIPFDMEYHDEYQNFDISLKKGRQTLDGRESENFVRYRSGYLRGDIDRMDAQKLFMSALISALKEKMSPTSVIKLAGTLIGEVGTNVKLSEIAELASLGFEISEKDITMVTLAGEDVRSSESGAWFYVLSKPSCQKLISECVGERGISSEFDPNGVFLNPSNEDFDRIYSSEADYSFRNCQN